MFRFLYSKILLKPCHVIKEHRAMARKHKLEEENGIETNRVNNNGWSIDDNNNDNSIKKTTNTIINETDENDDEQLGNRRVTVPLTITMLIIALYIWAGSMIFNRFEQWTMIQSGYFCFVTLGIENIKYKKKYENLFVFSNNWIW
jgi:ABC-type multidrug transport system permease subunit